MKNAYEIRGEVATIFVAWRGRREEVLVDREDLARVARYTWRLNKGRNTVYACANVPGQPGKKIWLHKLVVGAGVATKVDHRNWCGLDNRKANLRRLDHVRNALNARFGFVHPDNRTGERGVRFDEKRARAGKKPWRAALQFRKVRRFLGGWYATKADAVRAVTAELERRGLTIYVPTAAEHERLEGARALAHQMGGGGR